MNWPDEKLERTMLDDAQRVLENANEGSAASDLACHTMALLARVRELDTVNAALLAACKGMRDEFRDPEIMGVIHATGSPEDRKRQAFTHLMEAIALAEKGAP